MPQDNLIGKQLGDVIVQERVGRNGSVLIYRGFNIANNKSVLIETIQINTRDQATRATFEKAAAKVVNLDHLHIIKMFGYGVAEGFGYLVIDMLRGDTLSDYLTDNKVPNFLQTVHIISQLAQGLTYAHARGVIHADLRPETVIIDDSSNAYLTQFDITSALTGKELVSSRDGLTVLPSFVAPEYLQGGKPDQQTDIYSLGMLLYRMTTGELPFNMDGGVQTILNRHLYDTPPSPGSVNPAIPRSLENVILKAIAKQPSERYQTVTEFSEALNSAIGDLYTNRTALDTIGASNIEELEIEANPVFITRSQPESNVGIRVQQWILAGTALFVVMGLLYVLFLVNTTTLGTILNDTITDAADIEPQTGTVQRAVTYLTNQNAVVAYISCNRTSEFHSARARELEQMATAQAIPFRVYDSDNDPSREVAHIQSAQTDNAAVIIMCVLNPETALPLLQDAVEQEGVFVVMDHTDLMGDLDGVYIYTSNYDMGYVTGRYAGRYVRGQQSTANVIILDFPDLSSIVERANGLEDGFLASMTNANMIGRWQGATQEFGELSVEQLLADGVEFDVILSINDAGAYGAIRALENAGYNPDDVMIFSIDAEQTARRYIEEGYYIRASLTVGREAGSKALLDAAISLLGGQDVPAEIISEPGSIYAGEGATDGS